MNYYPAPMSKQVPVSENSSLRENSCRIKHEFTRMNRIRTNLDYKVAQKNYPVVFSSKETRVYKVVLRCVEVAEELVVPIGGYFGRKFR